MTAADIDLREVRKYYRKGQIDIPRSMV